MSTKTLATQFHAPLPAVALDPERGLAVRLDETGEPTVERPSFQGLGSAFASILVPEALIAQWLGMGSVLALTELMKAGTAAGTIGPPVVLEPLPGEGLPRGTVIRSFPFKSVMNLLHKYRAGQRRDKAIEAAWAWVDLAVLAVLEQGLRASQSLVQQELVAQRNANLQLKDAQARQLEAATARLSDELLPPVTPTLFPEGANPVYCGGLVRACWTATEIFLRFPRTSDHDNVERARINFAPTKPKENHTDWREILTPKTILPIHYIDGEGAGNTIVVGYKITPKIDTAWFPEESERAVVMLDTAKTMADNMDEFLKNQRMARGVE